MAFKCLKVKPPCDFWELVGDKTARNYKHLLLKDKLNHVFMNLHYNFDHSKNETKLMRGIFQIPVTKFVTILIDNSPHIFL